MGEAEQVGTGLRASGGLSMLSCGVWGQLATSPKELLAPVLGALPKSLELLCAQATMPSNHSTVPPVSPHSLRRCVPCGTHALPDTRRSTIHAGRLLQDVVWRTPASEGPHP